MLTALLRQRRGLAGKLLDVAIGSCSDTVATGPHAAVRQTATSRLFLREAASASQATLVMPPLQPRHALSPGSNATSLPAQQLVQTNNATDGFWRSFGPAVAGPRINVFAFFHNSLDDPLTNYVPGQRPSQRMPPTALPNAVCAPWAMKDERCQPSLLSLDPFNVERFQAECDAALAAQLAAQAGSLAALPFRQRVAYVVRTRLEMHASSIGNWSVVIALRDTDQQHGMRTMVRLGAALDNMWRAAGDPGCALDPFSQRMLLAGIYLNTERRMTTDQSPGFANTWLEMQREIAESYGM